MYLVLARTFRSAIIALTLAIPSAALAQNTESPQQQQAPTFNLATGGPPPSFKF